MTISWAHGAVEPESVFQIPKGEIVNDHRPNVPEAVFWREGDFRYWRIHVGLEKHKRTGGRMGAEDGKIDASRDMAHAEGQKMPAA